MENLNYNTCVRCEVVSLHRSFVSDGRTAWLILSCPKYRHMSFISSPLLSSHIMPLDYTNILDLLGKAKRQPEQPEYHKDVGSRNKLSFVDMVLSFKSWLLDFGRTFSAYSL